MVLFALLLFSLGTLWLLFIRKVAIVYYQNTLPFSFIIEILWKWQRPTKTDTENFIDRYRILFSFWLFLFDFLLNIQSISGQAKARAALLSRPLTSLYYHTFSECKMLTVCGICGCKFYTFDRVYLIQFVNYGAG
jgi:hypothetical protein